MKRKALVTASCLVAAFTLTFRAQGPAPAKPLSGQYRFESDAALVWTAASTAELGRQLERSPWKPASNSERPRGGLELYSKVAPAVVVVRTDTGHGTGFIVSPEGHVLTNHHVVADGLRHDIQKSASYALVHLGQLGADGVMRLRDEPVRGLLLKSDPAVDLALLKLETIPPELKPLPSITLSSVAPRPGQPATIVGHPASGMLWTLRSGEVASIGRMPADLVDVVMLQLAGTQGERRQLVEQLKQAPSRRILITSAGANPGDSGGPVVDSTGRLIAVTFAVPAEVSQAKFSYHVHLDEVKAFMAKMPAAPRLSVPDPWQLATRVAVRDVDRDGRADVLMAGTDKPEELLFDLDNDTPAAAVADVPGLVRDRKWEFEFALRVDPSEPTSTAFYDTDNDGTIDLIHTVVDNDHTKNTRFVRTADGNWRAESNVTLTFPSATYLKDRAD